MRKVLRLRRLKQLGWEEIDCIFCTLDDIDRQIWEIDENLYRKELTTDEMRDHLRRRKALWEKRKKKQVGHGVPRHHEKGFAAETAKATGLSKRQINRLIADRPRSEPRPDKIPPDRDEPDMKGIARRHDADCRPWAGSRYSFVPNSAASGRPFNLAETHFAASS